MKVETDVLMVLGPFSNALGGKSVLEAFQREMTKKMRCLLLNKPLTIVQPEC